MLHNFYHKFHIFDLWYWSDSEIIIFSIFYQNLEFYSHLQMWYELEFIIIASSANVTNVVYNFFMNRFNVGLHIDFFAFYVANITLFFHSPIDRFFVFWSQVWFLRFSFLFFQFPWAFLLVVGFQMNLKFTRFLIVWLFTISSKNSLSYD